MKQESPAQLYLLKFKNLRVQVVSIFTDADNNPMPDVAMMINGGRIGRTTDQHVKFSTEAIQCDVFAIASVDYNA